MSSKYDFTAQGFWKKGKIVGRGGSSTVYEATVQSSGELIAAKEIQIDGLTKAQILAIEAEVNTIKSLSHKHIVNYLGTQLLDRNFYIFLEYADRGSLRHYYRKHGKLTEPQVACCTRQLLLGLAYLHSNDIAHRDIKGANVLLTKEGEMKLADFGASKRYDTASVVSGLKGTPQWMAPEVIKGTQLTSGWMKADVWSLGCTVVEMLTGNIPYAEFENPMTAMYHIANGKTPPLDKDTVSEEAISFVETCCNVEPSNRPSVEELLLHNFVKNVDDNETIEVIDDDLLESESENKDELMKSAEMKIILTGNEIDKENLYQSPDNSPPPSPPKEDDHCDKSDKSSNGAGRVDDCVIDISGDAPKNQSITHAEDVKTIKRPPALNKANFANSSQQDNDKDDADEALRVLQLQKTPSIHSACKRSRKKKSRETSSRGTFSNYENGTAGVPTPPASESSHGSSTRIRRQSKEGFDRLKNKSESRLVDDNAAPDPKHQDQNNSEDNPLRVCASGSGDDTIVPVNNGNISVEQLDFARDREIHSDNSEVEHEARKQDSSGNRLKRNKKTGFSKSFNDKDKAVKPLSLAKLLSKKLSNGTKLSHQSHSEGENSWNDDSQDSSSGSDLDLENKSSVKLGKVEKIVTRSESNTPPMFHDGHSLNEDKMKDFNQKIDESNEYHTENKRPVAPFTSEKLYLHNNLGAENFSKAAQGGAAAVRKEAKLSLKHNNHYSSHLSSHKARQGGYNTGNRSHKHVSSLKRGSKRSKSANVSSTGTKLVLPSLNDVRNNSKGDVVVIPQLALRVIQSAPTVTRSLNLPPLLKSSTPKSNPKSGFGSVFPEGINAKKGDDFQLLSKKVDTEQAEREGGILAPRKPDP